MAQDHVIAISVYRRRQRSEDQHVRFTPRSRGEFERLQPMLLAARDQAEVRSIDCGTESGWAPYLDVVFLGMMPERFERFSFEVIR